MKAKIENSSPRKLDLKEPGFYHSLNYCIDFAHDWKDDTVPSNRVKESTWAKFQQHVTKVMACKNVSNWTELTKPEQSVFIPDKETIATKHLVAFLMLDSRFSKVPNSVQKRLKAARA